MKIVGFIASLFVVVFGSALVGRWLGFSDEAILMGSVIGASSVAYFNLLGDD